MSRRDNTRTTIPIEGAPPGVRTMRQLRIYEMAALEQLPPSVRFLLSELAINLAAWKVLAYYRSIASQAVTLGGSPFDAEIWTLRKLAALEAQDIDAFAALYRARHGAPLPHAAASVSVLRYGPLGPRGRVRASQALARRGLGRLPMPPEIREAA